MKYGMRERISGGIILVAIAVILVLFFFGRPGHRDDKAAAPDVSFNQQPVTDTSGDQPLTLPSSATADANNVAVNPAGNNPATAAPELNVQNNVPATDAAQTPAVPTTVHPQGQPAAIAIQPAPPAVSVSQPPVRPAPVAPSKPAPAPPARKVEKPAPETKPIAPATKPTKLASSDPIMNAAQHNDVPPAPVAKPAAPAAAPATTVPAPTEGWSVQAGSFGNTDNAQRLVQRLAQNGFKAYMLKREPNTVVLVGPFSTSQAAEEARTQMQQRAATNGLVVRNGKH